MPARVGPTEEKDFCVARHIPLSLLYAQPINHVSGKCLLSRKEEEAESERPPEPSAFLSFFLLFHSSVRSSVVLLGFFFCDFRHSFPVRPPPPSTTRHMQSHSNAFIWKINENVWRFHLMWKPHGPQFNCSILLWFLVALFAPFASLRRAPEGCARLSGMGEKATLASEPELVRSAWTLYELL